MAFVALLRHAYVKHDQPNKRNERNNYTQYPSAKRSGASPKGTRSPVILLSPKGKKFDQKMAKRLSKCKQLILICGHYEGIDERVKEGLADEEISIGDYILTGGELAALVLIDAVSRLIPDVLGNPESIIGESFSLNLLEYPQYTRPAEYKGWIVPDVLLSGNHAQIEHWHKYESLKRTYQRRPDLLKKIKLSAEDKKYLKKIKLEDI